MNDPLPADDPERSELYAVIAERNQQLRVRSLADAEPALLSGDLTLQQLRVLMQVARAPGLTNQELGRALGVSAPTTTGLIDRLSEKGFLGRHEDEADRRIRRLQLTPAGEQLIDGLDSLSHRLFAELLPMLTTDDLRSMVRMYDKLLEVLDRVSR